MNRSLSNVLVSVMSLVLAASGCRPNLHEIPTQSDETWKGKSIHIDAVLPLRVTSSAKKFEVRFGDHEIIIEEHSISLDGATSAVSDFSKVNIKKDAEDVDISVDGKKLFSP